MSIKKNEIIHGNPYNIPIQLEGDPLAGFDYSYSDVTDIVVCFKIDRNSPDDMYFIGKRSDGKVELNENDHSLVVKLRKADYDGISNEERAYEVALAFELSDGECIAVDLEGHLNVVPSLFVGAE